MLRRSLRARVRVGAAARRRIQDGGPRATGRLAATVEEWAAIRRVVFRRARWRCQACGRWGALEIHHVVKRAQGGSDFDLDRLSSPPTTALIRHARSFILQLAESYLTSTLFRQILGRIERLA